MQFLYRSYITSLKCYLDLDEPIEEDKSIEAPNNHWEASLPRSPIGTFRKKLNNAINETHRLEGEVKIMKDTLEASASAREKESIISKQRNYKIYRENKMLKDL